jgi:hypothetical protein
MQGEQLPLTGEQGRVFLLTSPLIGLANDRDELATTQSECSANNNAVRATADHFDFVAAS